MYLRRKYSVNLFIFIIQALTVLEQLNAGIRYFDFRIAHKPDDPSMDLYFVHMLYTTVVVEVQFILLLFR